MSFLDSGSGDIKRTFTDGILSRATERFAQGKRVGYGRRPRRVTMVETTWRAALAEFVASFAFVLIGMGSAIVAGPYGSGLIGEALSAGFVLAAMISVTAHISGGHVNPAVTIGVWVAGKISSVRAVVYILAQVAGGILAAVVLRVVLPPAEWRVADLATPVLSRGVGPGKGILIEALATFLLVFAFFGTMLDERGPFFRTAGLTVGLVTAVDILAFGPLTGAATNPVRSLAPALISGTWDDWWVYWMGPLAGGVIGAVLYWSAFLRHREPQVPER
jgi:MIP family channel proteins